MELIAIIISAISFLAVVYQNVNLKITLGNQIYESFVANSLEIDRLLIEYPEARKYIYYGAPVDDTTPDIDRIMSIMEFVIDAMENIEVYKKYIPKNRREGWLKFVDDMKATPLYSYYLEKHGGWFKVSK